MTSTTISWWTKATSISRAGRVGSPPLLTLVALATVALGPWSGCAETPLPGMEKEVRPADLDALKAAGAKANGLVAWTSSRAGLPHIFSMKTDGSETKQLTRGDRTDWRPRFSPDGQLILFARSRGLGFVRESDANSPGAWDLYTIPSGGGEVTRVVVDASWGSWAGADEVVFMRGSKIMRKKLGGEVETEAKVMDTSRHAFFDGVTVQQPELSHDGHFVALTLTGNHRQAGIWNIKKKVWTSMGQGRQIAWAPDGASVYWNDDRGKENGRIAHEPVVAGIPADEADPDKQLLVDLGGKRSRERFPRLSNDGKWLVFGAAINDLEDDLEDYELFLWEAGTSATSATRLTFNTSSDRWPDLFVGEAGKAPAPAGEEPSGADEKPAPAGKAEPETEGQGDAPKAEPAEAEPKAKAAAEEEPDESTPAPASTAKPKGKKKKHR